MTPIYNLFEMYEPAFILNSQLTDDDASVIHDHAGAGLACPSDKEEQAAFVEFVRYFARLRTATEVRAALEDLGIDEEDFAAAVGSGLLITLPATRWLEWPDSQWEEHAWLLGSLVVMQLAPLAPLQNRGPDAVVLLVPDRDDRVAIIDRFSSEVIRDAMRQPAIRLGLALERAAAEHGRDRENAWRRLGADLATLLRTGTAAVAVQGWLMPHHRIRRTLVDAHPALSRPRPVFEIVLPNR